MILRREFLVVLAGLTAILAFTYSEPAPVRKLMDWRAFRHTQGEKHISVSQYQIYDQTNGEDAEITIDFLKGRHFWNPQIAIWIEDQVGNHVRTLLVTTSTAKGLFYSGRTASNFRESDGVKKRKNIATRRVDALPYWSHKRNVKYNDGYYSPPREKPLPDAITCATPVDNFLFSTSGSGIDQLTSFRIMVEVNVAFDENEFYSEYDFTDDSLYHGGTGLLGQPSLIYGTTVTRDEDQRYYVMRLLGHGHHSGGTGELLHDLTTITTAKHIVERIVAGVKEEWYQNQPSYDTLNVVSDRRDLQQ